MGNSFGNSCKVELWMEIQRNIAGGMWGLVEELMGNKAVQDRKEGKRRIGLTKGSAETRSREGKDMKFMENAKMREHLLKWCNTDWQTLLGNKLELSKADSGYKDEEKKNQEGLTKPHLTRKKNNFREGVKYGEKKD